MGYINHHIFMQSFLVGCINMEQRKFDSIEERIDFIEFRQQLLFDNDNLSRLLFEYQITENEYRRIMDYMDSLRNKIDNGEKIYSSVFEDEIYKIVPSHYGDYYFCEYIARAFWESGRWEEVFPALYKDSPKYRYLFSGDS